MSNRNGVKETLGFAAVVASLVFVGFEIRESNIQARAAAYQELGLGVSESWATMAQHRDLNSLVRESQRAGNDPSWWGQQDQASLDQLFSMNVGVHRMYETVYRQVLTGLLDEDALESLGWTSFITSGAPYQWPELRGWMDEYFVVYLEDAWGITP